MNREPPYLQRFQGTVASNPLLGWLVAVGIQSVVCAFLLCFFPDARKPGMVFFIASSVLGSPTFHLLRRFSERERSFKPIALQQEKAVGLASLFAALGSIAALFVMAYGRRLGWFLSADVTFDLLVGYAFLLMLAVAFGFAARHTKLGLLGLRIAVIWAAILTSTGLLLLFQWRL